MTTYIKELAHKFMQLEDWQITRECQEATETEADAVELERQVRLFMDVLMFSDAA